MAGPMATGEKVTIEIELSSLGHILPGAWEASAIGGAITGRGKTRLNAIANICESLYFTIKTYAAITDEEAERTLAPDAMQLRKRLREEFAEKEDANA